jgi:hypothetical protein
MARVVASLIAFCLLVSFDSLRAQDGTCRCQTPEEALDFYLEALRLGANDRLSAVYWGGGYDLSEPIAIQDYWVLDRHVLTQDLHPEGPCSLWSKAGTVRLYVRQSFSGERSENYTYFVRKIDGAWFIVGHSSDGDSDDFVDDP